MSVFGPFFSIPHFFDQTLVCLKVHSIGFSYLPLRFQVCIRTFSVYQVPLILPSTYIHTSGFTRTLEKRQRQKAPGIFIHMLL